MGDLDSHLTHVLWSHPSPQPKQDLDNRRRKRKKQKKEEEITAAKYNGMSITVGGRKQ